MIEMVALILSTLNSSIWIIKWMKNRFFPTYDADRVLSDRFKEAYPLIEELAAAKPPYVPTKLGSLEKELNFLQIKHPVNPVRWPKYLLELKRLSKKGNFKQARQILAYYDSTP